MPARNDGSASSSSIRLANDERVAVVDEEPGATVVDQASGGRPPRRPPPGSRRPSTRARRDRRTPSAMARRRRPRRGSRSTARDGAVAARTAPGRRDPAPRSATRPSRARRGPSRPEGPPDHHQPGIAPVIGRGQRAHRDVEALERLDPADEEQHRLVAQAERTAGAPLVAGREERVVHAGRDELDPIGRRAVVVDEIVGLDRVGGGDGVGAPDDRGLGVGPLVPARDRPRLGLHPGEGVEGATPAAGRARA